MFEFSLQYQGQMFGGASAGVGVEGSAIAFADLSVRGVNAARYPAPLRPSTSTGGKRRGGIYLI